MPSSPSPSSDSPPPPGTTPPPAIGHKAKAGSGSSPASVPLFGAVGAARLNEIQEGRARLKKTVTNDGCALVVASANSGPGGGGDSSSSSSSGVQPIEGLMSGEGLSANGTSAVRLGEAGGAGPGTLSSHASAPADQRLKDRGAAPTKNDEQSSMETAPAASKRVATAAATARPAAIPRPRPRMQAPAPEPLKPDQEPSPAAATIAPLPPGAANAGRPLSSQQDGAANDCPTIPAPPPPMFGLPLPAASPFTTLGRSQSPEGTSPLSQVGAGKDQVTTPAPPYPMFGRPLPPPPGPTLSSLRTLVASLLLSPDNAGDDWPTKPAPPPPMFAKRPPPDSNRSLPSPPENRAGQEAVRMKIGIVLVEAVLGNIVDEVTDAIVNGTSNDMDLTGHVSRALLEKGGSKVSADCKAKGEIGNAGVFSASTTGTSLQCKYILHVDVLKPLNFLIKKCLKEADRLQLLSISLPTLGTGKQQERPENVIPRLVREVREFAAGTTLSYLRLIRFVAFDSSAFELFKREMTAAGPHDDWMKGKKLDYQEDIIDQDSPEFSKVKDAFFETASRTLTCIQIKRIQNPTLLKQYEAQKEKVASDMLSSSTLPIERWLWHGTDEASRKKICLHGFNRSYCGLNGIVYGQGVYFARDAAYSTKYSKANDSGVRQMIYSRVLTGEFIHGNKDMRAPPSRPHGSQANYDSSVDSVENPSIFVVYHDSQAYPEFVIKFR